MKAKQFLLAESSKQPPMWALLAVIACLFVGFGALGLREFSKPIVVPAAEAKSEKKYPLHKNITSTVFWVGEGATGENDYISNAESAWDDEWADHFGGTDDPNSRNGFHPSGFTPNENPFYVALPYNDFNDDGDRKKTARKTVYWGKSQGWGDLDSMCKNRWVRIQKGSKTVYAQWEDSGPFQYDDSKYVFGKKKPKNRVNNRAGIDVSPAVRDYLGLSDMDKVKWKFVGASSVPAGPWKEIVTTRQITWE